MSDASGRGLQKYDSCYRLEIITSQDLVIHNAGHVHSSRDCLISTEMNTVRFFQSGIDAPPFEQKGDVIVHENGHAMNDEDNNVTTTKERVDDLVQSYGLLEVTLVKPQTSKTDQLELLALEEHSMCYNADILILSTTNKACPTGPPTVKYYPKDMPTAVEISLDNERTPLTLYFSAPVDEKSSKAQLLTEKKRLRCHFPKSEIGVFGRACIKRPAVTDFLSLPTWTGIEELNLLMFCTQSDEREAVSNAREAFVELQNALQCIIASFVEFPQKNTCFTIHEPRDTEVTTPNLTLVVLDVYSRKQVPLAKVMFCDHSVTAFPSESDRNSLTAAKYREILIKMMKKKQESPMIHVTKQGQVLLRRLLYTNAKRVTQTERLNPVWITSILQLRFQEDKTLFKLDQD